MPEAEWQLLFGCPAPARLGSLLARAAAWQRQVDTHGDVSRAVREDLRLAARAALEARGLRGLRGLRGGGGDDAPGPRPAEASPADPPARARRSRPARQALPPASAALVPGTRLVKQHGGRTHVVEVVEGGVAYEGATYASLSAVAKVITGTHWNGLLFFGLRRRKTYPARQAPDKPAARA